MSVKLTKISILIQPFNEESTNKQKIQIQLSQYAEAESTKQMEQTLRAKVKTFFKSENLKKCF